MAFVKTLSIQVGVNYITDPKSTRCGWNKMKSSFDHTERRNNTNIMIKVIPNAGSISKANGVSPVSTSE